MDYSSCRQMLARITTTTERERLSLDSALSRATGSDLRATVPQPEFRQSLRDGYILAQHQQDFDGDCIFPVTGTIQAGSRESVKMIPGQACRIMTGGMVPDGGVRIIPQEDCWETDGLIKVTAKVLHRKHTFIQEQGSEVAAGEVVVKAGTVLYPEHISLLASVGCEQLEVFRRPRVGFLCSGSELVDTPKELHPGLKVSSNRYLLDGLLRRRGAEPVYLGTVNDSNTALTEAFSRLQSGSYDVVISTGGMGPGKYDLIEQNFLAAGGDLLYNSLELRPGKASLCGILGKTLFFGLPGPPTAVRALVNCIVGPTLMQMQGIKGEYPQTLHAHLLHPLTIKRAGVMQLRGGTLSFHDGRCMVKTVDKLEASSCYLFIAAEKDHYQAGELIEVQLTENPFSRPSLP